MNTPIDWTDLNAYVDGELDATARAEIAAAIACDADLAARVATLARLKAVTVASGAMPGQREELPPLPGLAALPSRRSEPVARARPRRRALAAALILVLLSGAGAWWLRGPGPPEPLARIVAESPLGRAAALHQGWLALPVDPGASPAAPLGRTNGVFEGTSLPPELGRLGLRLVHRATHRGADGAVDALFGYVGPNGCRLGLWIGQPTGVGAATTPPTPTRISDLEGYVWTGAGRHYAVLAHGMDSPRLGRFALAIAEILARDEALDAARLAALSAATTGPTCTT